MVGVASYAARVRVAPARAGAVQLVAACLRGLPCRWPAVGGTPTSTNRLQLRPLSTSCVFERGEGVEPTFLVWLGWGRWQLWALPSRRVRPWRRPSRPRARPYPPPPPAVAVPLPPRCGRRVSKVAAHASCGGADAQQPIWQAVVNACSRCLPIADLLSSRVGARREWGMSSRAPVCRWWRGGWPRWPRGCACLPRAPCRGRRRRRGWLDFLVASPVGGGRSPPAVWRQRWRCGERESGGGDGQLAAIADWPSPLPVAAGFMTAKGVEEGGGEQRRRCAPSAWRPARDTEVRQRLHRRRVVTHIWRTGR